MIHLLLQSCLAKAVESVLPGTDARELVIRPCPDPSFGDYQTSAVMTLAKRLKANPRKLAADVVSKLEVGEWCDAVEIAGPGFLNFRLKPDAVTGLVRAAIEGGSLFYSPAAQPRTFVVDFSSPNVAKAMHVGHIRSTILGDSISRILRALGHRVITDNHIGDWGTQFGKLLVGWKEDLNREALAQDPIGEMERLYKQVNAQSEADPGVLEKARAELVRLQKGDEENLGIWREMISLSQQQFETIYRRLGVQFDYTLGESFYNEQLAGVVESLIAAGLAQDSEGAKVVFFNDDPELKAHPALVLKSDGAANYTTTDLATLEYRVRTWNPDEVVYVTDGRQQLHFKQLFRIFQRWHPGSTMKLVHVWFGTILGPDGKPFKTRSGETVKLTDLLDEAEERALRVVAGKNPDLPADVQKEISTVIGIGAIKYADLLPNRQSDYVFDWDRMLALNGNTAPYLQYAHTRILSIFRKGEAEAGLSEEALRASAGKLQLLHPDEMALAKHLLNFGLVLESVLEDFRPNFLCNYLYELAGLFARFYENCPVLKAASEVRTSRLALCLVTAKVLRKGLTLLGIEAPERM